MKSIPAISYHILLLSIMHIKTQWKDVTSTLAANNNIDVMYRTDRRQTRQHNTTISDSVHRPHTETTHRAHTDHIQTTHRPVHTPHTDHTHTHRAHIEHTQSTHRPHIDHTQTTHRPHTEHT